MSKDVKAAKQRPNRRNHSPEKLQMLMTAARNVAVRGSAELAEIGAKRG